MVATSQATSQPRPLNQPLKVPLLLQGALQAGLAARLSLGLSLLATRNRYQQGMNKQDRSTRRALWKHDEKVIQPSCGVR